jgi:hypothetical protein
MWDINRVIRWPRHGSESAATFALAPVAPGDGRVRARPAVPSLVDKLGLIGTREELGERLAAMSQAGINEIVIQPVVDPEVEMTELAKLIVRP